VEVGVPGVKRHYDGSARRARAEQVRQALLDTAREMLLRDGYAATTIPQLARACGVSPESVYKRFPGKPALLRAVVTRALEGAGPVAAETRSDALPAEDLTSLLRGWAHLTSEVAPRVAPILLLVHAAAVHDRELDELDRELDDNRRARMAANARRLAAAGHLPDEFTVERAGDILWTYSSPQLYDLLVLRSGWDLDQYAHFIADSLAAHFGAGALRSA
jgi:AcrR family transcriptional regulator